MVSHLRCFANKSRECCAVLLLFCLVFFTGTSANAFAKKQIKLGGRTFVVEVAESPDQHQRGLMFREKLGENEGMLFIFDNEETRFFWMKNTLIDLSIGYFDKKGVLVDVQEMKSGKGVPDAALPSYPSALPAKYALEMTKGWFEKNKVKIGSKLTVQ